MNEKYTNLLIKKIKENNSYNNNYSTLLKKPNYDYSDLTVGVLALQGAFREHIEAVKRCGAKAIQVRLPKQLSLIDGLIIPGGESTTIIKLIEKYNFKTHIYDFYKSNKPIFGTCAGLILLAKEIVGFNFGLGLIDICVDRNAYGRQIDSFEHAIELKIDSKLNYNVKNLNSDADKNIKKFANNNIDINNILIKGQNNRKFNAIFIRAPKILSFGKNVKVLAELDGKAVLAQQDNVLVCAFHPELTDDLRIHYYFLDIIKKAKNMINFN